MLTEKSAPLNYIKESGVGRDGKHYLGKLAGVASDWTKQTRNGRRYPKELWINVQNSDDFKEGMETLTIFGEADHPEDRIDTSIKEIAIVLTKYEIREAEGCVYAEFDILDTPNGRILKELLDYGSKIGVSSRGLGDEIEKDGEVIIDPDTYVFYGYDAVIMPAVATARPTVVESVEAKSSTSLLETFNREIDNATSVADLRSIERIAESTNIPDLDSVKESINTKISSYSEGEDISAIKEDLATSQKKVESLTKQLSARDTRIASLKKVISQLTESSSSMRKLLMQANRDLKDRDESILEGVDQIEDLTVELESARSEVTEIKARNRKLEATNASLRSQNSKLEHNAAIAKSNYKKKLDEATTTISTLKKSNANLSNKVSALSKQIDSVKSKATLTEQNSSRTTNALKERLRESNKSTREATKKYLEVKCAESGISVETALYNLPENYSTKDIDHVVGKLSDRKDRLSKVSFIMPSAPARVVEVSTSRSAANDEDVQTMRFLEESKKSN